MWEPRSLITYGRPRPVTGIALPYLYLYIYYIYRPMCKVTMKLNLWNYPVLVVMATVCQALNSYGCRTGMGTDYGLDGRRGGVQVPVGARFFRSPRRTDRMWGSPSLLSNGYRGGGSFPGADNSPPTGAEAKNKWICTSTPPYVAMA
jgi:hypothetical protein